MVPKTERFELRIDEEILQRIDAWRDEDPERPSRAEAVRRLVDAGLARASSETVRFTDGEKLIILMLRDLYKHLGLTNPEIDPTFVSEVIWGGHYWAAKWELPGIFHGYEDDPRHVHEVLDVLEMWDSIERAHDALSKADKKKLEKDASPFGKHVKFHGFDGNNESAYMGIAKFLINKLHRFSRFERRDLNSHAPSLAMYRRMLAVYMPMREGLMGIELNLAQLGKILRSQAHAG